ncbi:MAG: hypothetical protein ACYDB4_19125, partial [Candidatus Dormibacteraceae bacterium]
MLKRIDHVGVIVDSLEEAKRFLGNLGMEFDRDLELPLASGGMVYEGRRTSDKKTTIGHPFRTYHNPEEESRWPTPVW